MYFFFSWQKNRFLLSKELLMSYWQQSIIKSFFQLSILCLTTTETKAPKTKSVNTQNYNIIMFCTLDAVVTSTAVLCLRAASFCLSFSLFCVTWVLPQNYFGWQGPSGSSPTVTWPAPACAPTASAVLARGMPGAVVPLWAGRRRTYLRRRYLRYRHLRRRRPGGPAAPSDVEVAHEPPVSGVLGFTQEIPLLLSRFPPSRGGDARGGCGVTPHD